MMSKIIDELTEELLQKREQDNRIWHRVGGSWHTDRYYVVTPRQLAEVYFFQIGSKLLGYNLITDLAHIPKHGGRKNE